jgi:LuxR family transcriptional regulator, maltose regulon positive regulatory protein
MRERTTPEEPRSDGGVVDRIGDARPAVLEAKLRRPYLRDGIISRSALVDRMSTRRSEPLVAVVAPPGYGKTTLLAEWAARQGTDVAWVSVDEGDNDPSVLLAATAIALSRVQPIEARVVDALNARTMATPRALAALTSAVSPMRSTALVLDSVDSVGNSESLDVLAELVWRLPSGSRLAYSSRSPLPMPTPLLRSRGAIVEIGSDDLAMDRGEAQQLLTGAGVELSPEEIDQLWEQTEGWPAGLYLAGLASKGRRGATAFAFRGDDVLMGDYLRSEILSHLPTETVSFLTRTSVLEQLSGPLCDAVLGSSGSQGMLESLESSNLLVVPLDRHRGWYRYHRLFRDLLATELERREPELAATLHGRAAEWLDDHGMREPAIRHAQRSGHGDLVVRLVAAATQPAYAAGRAADVQSWLEWFRARDLIDRYPSVAVFGALVEALSGRPASAERWAAAAEAADEADFDDSFIGSRAYVRSVLCRDGTTQMRADAQLAKHMLGASPLRPGVLIFEALSYLLDGDTAAADPLLAHAYDVAVYAEARPAATASAGLRGMIAVGRGDWDEAERFADQALSVVAAGHLQDYIEASIAYAVAARTAAHRGDIGSATDHLARAVRLRQLLTYAVPASALMQLEIVRAYLQLGDPVGARTVLREVRDTLHQRPNLGIVGREADELYRAAEAVRQAPAGVSSLTSAELRLLPFLATHLSFREIGERLHVSRHTVKTQGISVYRKLGVSSRSEAIRMAHEIGLLGQ